MTTNTKDLLPVRRALLSVSDKTNLIEFARELASSNVEIISTGGTARLLRDAGIDARDVSDVTGFPEMMDGRVKTLHPRIHGGLLARRDDDAHMRAAEAHSIGMIDLLVVNLYPFERTVARADVTLDEAIENIDIGGPAMIRSAAKNFRHVAVVVSPDAYAEVAEELRRNGGSLSYDLRARLAWQAFERTALYDVAVFGFLASRFAKEGDQTFAHFPAMLGIEPTDAAVMNHIAALARTDAATEPASDDAPRSVFADSLAIYLAKKTDLRYGENPHQAATLYVSSAARSFGVAGASVLHGKEMSYNNYVDADAAWALVCDFDAPACAIIKHTNPAGASVAPSLAEAYTRALAADPVSAFGGIVAFNRRVDADAARRAIEIFTEVVVAPEYDDDALAIFRTKKNLRVLRAGAPRATDELQTRQISGGTLIQTPDTHRLTPDALRTVTRRHPTDAEIADLLFAWTVCKHTKSNAIVYARDLATVGVGAGQMSRVDSVRLGAERARNNNLEVKGSVLASDAFFPFRDGLDAAAGHGITACIQPGGSVRDAEVIAAADEHDIAMVFTGIRHFRH